MGRTSKLLFAGLALACCILFPVKSRAEQRNRPAQDATQVHELMDIGDPVSSEVLDSLSGGQGMSIDTIDMLMNNMNLNAELKGNLIYSATTGINQISDDAFSNANGISTVVQNSGNQVIINNAFILNLQMK